MNCHGCKWLDRYKKDGNGYCCKVERLQGRAFENAKKQNPTPRYETLRTVRKRRLENPLGDRR